MDLNPIFEWYVLGLLGGGGVRSFLIDWIYSVEEYIGIFGAILERWDWIELC